MHHVVRLNVAGRGYAVYAGDPQSGFRPQPLGVPTDAVSASVQAAFDRLDSVLETRQVPATVCLRRAAGGPVVVAYGTRVAEADEHGRSGLTFAHAFEIDDPGRVYAGVAAVVTVMAAGPARQLLADVRKVARGDRGVAVAEVIQQAVEGIEEAFAKHRDLRPPTADTGRPAAIRHDCAGAPVLAWLSSAAAVRTAPPPWEVYDQIGSDGDVETRLVPANGGRMAASAVLWPTATLPGRLPAEPAPRRRSFVPWLVAAALLATTLGLAVVAAAPDKKLLARLDTTTAEKDGLVNERDGLKRDGDRNAETIRQLSAQVVAAQAAHTELEGRLDAAKKDAGAQALQAQLTIEREKSAKAEKKMQEEVNKEKAAAAEREKNIRTDSTKELDKVRADSKWAQDKRDIGSAWKSGVLRHERDESQRQFVARSRAVLAAFGTTTFESKLLTRLLDPNRPVGQLLAETTHPNPITCAAFDPNRNWLAFGDAAGGRVVIDLAKRQPRLAPITDAQPVTAVAVRMDGVALFAHQSGSVQRSAQGEAATAAFSAGPGNTVTTIDWAAGEAAVFAGRATTPQPGGLLGSWNGQPTVAPTVEVLPPDVTFAVRHPAGQYRYLVRGKSFTVQDTILGTPPQGPWECAADIRNLEANAKGDRVACIVGTSVELWSLALPMATRVATLPADLPPAGPVVVRFTPDGTRLLTCRGDGSVLVWDTTTGRCALTLGKWPGQVLAVSLGDDGRLLTCLRSDTRVQVWDGLPN